MPSCACSLFRQDFEGPLLVLIEGDFIPAKPAMSYINSCTFIAAAKRTTGPSELIDQNYEGQVTHVLAPHREQSREARATEHQAGTVAQQVQQEPRPTEMVRPRDIYIIR